jgi:predicted phage terminase large subunit-like protein
MVAQITLTDSDFDFAISGIDGNQRIIDDARKSLLAFTLFTFPEYRVNWHHRLLCEYLDKFVSGEINRLIVSMPPRHGKSELVSRRLPAYILGKNPDMQIMATSYAASLSQRFNRDVQRIIDSAAYKILFPDTHLFGKNIRTVASGTWIRNSDMFEIVNHLGSYRNAGVGGGITGMGFDRGIIDDPFKDAKESNSPTIRDRIAEWFYSTFYTRQQKNAGICITMTRWHMDDLVGRVLDAMSQVDGEQWTVLELPSVLYDLDNKHPLDPRNYDEALWKDQYNREFLRTIEAQNKFVFSALYQQKPIPQGEGLFDVGKIEIIDNIPSNLSKVRFYDLAVTSNQTSDYTAGVLLGRDSNGNVYVLHVYRAQKNPVAVKNDIVRQAQIDGTDTRIVLETENAGLVQLDYLLQEVLLAPYTITGVKPQGDKYTRAQPFASRVNTEKVFLLRGAWNQAYLDELSIFPMGAHDDQVDASSGAYSQLSARTTTVSIDTF